MSLSFDFFKIFSDFMTEMQETFPNVRETLESFENDVLHNENKNDAVNEVLVPLRPYSRQILTYDTELFTKPLICFGGVNLSELMQNAEHDTCITVIQHLEMLYISGNIFLKPQKKEQFYKACLNIKSKYSPKHQTEDVNDDTIQMIAGQVQQMFGTENETLGNLIGDVSKIVGNALKNNKPEDLMNAIFQNDMSVLGDSFQQLNKKYSSLPEKEMQGMLNGMTKRANEITQGGGLQDIMSMFGGGQSAGTGNGGNPMAGLMQMMQGLTGPGGPGGPAGLMAPGGPAGGPNNQQRRKNNGGRPLQPRNTVVERLENDKKNFSTGSAAAPKDDEKDTPSDNE